MKIKSARFIVPLVAYPYDLYVSLGETDDRFKEGLLRYKPIEWVNKALKKMAVPARSGCAKFGRNDGFYMIRTGVYPRNATDYGTLQHEIFHFVERLFSDIGIPHHVDYTSESYAYIIDYLTAETYTKIWANECF